MASVRKIRTSELRYRRLFEAAQDGHLLLDAQTSAITDVNPFLVKLLGHTCEEFIQLWMLRTTVPSVKAAAGSF